MQNVKAFTPREDQRNIKSYRRESSFWKECSLIDLDRGESVLELRFYGAGETCYAVAWVHGWRHGFPAAGETGSCRGYGKAGGYGYHKPSAAAAGALESAGFSFEEDLAGRGDSAIREALEAVAVCFGIARPMIHISHA